MSGTCEICFGRMGSLVDTKRGGRQKDWNSTRRGWEELLGNAEGGADKLHNITKSRLWRGGAQVIDDVLEDEQPLKRERERESVFVCGVAKIERSLASRYTTTHHGEQSRGRTKACNLWREHFGP